jgi:hypothetical protein
MRDDRVCRQSLTNANCCTTTQIFAGRTECDIPRFSMPTGVLPAAADIAATRPNTAGCTQF